MPTYTFQNKTTKKEWNEFLSISECDKYLADNPDVEVVIYVRAIVSGISGHHRPDEGFREILRGVRKRSGRDINTFD